MDFKNPIITDNRNFRQEIPEIGKYFDEVKKEVDVFPKENNIIVDPEIVKFVDCPVCGTSDIQQRFVKYGYIYATCNLCDHLFVQNRTREEVLIGLYSTSKSDKIDRTVRTTPQHLDYWGQVHKKYIDYIKSIGVDNGNLIDIGCGAGTFLHNSQQFTNMALHGLDFCEDTYDDIIAITGKGNYYYQQKIEDIDFGDKLFDVITLWGVLEHLASPVSVLGKCSKIITDDGVGILLFPNPNSRAIKILGAETPTLNPRGHVNLYSEKSFTHLARKTGFRIVERFQELPVIDLMYPYVHYTDELVEQLVENKECYYDVYIVKKA